MPALAKVLQQCRGWKFKHLLGTKELPRAEVGRILRLSLDLQSIPIEKIRQTAPLKGRRVFTFFAEPSTRTKTSFALAARAA